MALTDAEKAKIMRHLGYPDANVNTGIFAGVSYEYDLIVQARLQIENVNSTAEPRIREILTDMDACNTQKSSMASRRRVEELSGIKLNRGELVDVKSIYSNLGYELAEIIGCSVNEFSNRYANSINMRVVI